MKKICMILILLSMTLLSGFEYNFNDFTEFGETTGFPVACNVFMSKDDYIINKTSKGLSILYSEPDGSLTLVDTLITPDIESASIKYDYLALVPGGFAMLPIRLYNCEDMENIEFIRSIGTNQSYVYAYIIDINRIIVSSGNGNFIYDLNNGELLSNIQNYSIIPDTFLDDGKVLAYNNSTWLREWVYIDDDNEITPIKSENREVIYAKSNNSQVYLAVDNYIKRYETIFDEVAQDSIYIHWFDMSFHTRGIEFFDSKLYYLYVGFNPNSQMDEPKVKIYDIMENQLQFSSEKYFLENWDNRGGYLSQKVISCNDRIYINAEEEGVKGYQISDNGLQQVSQYGEIAYWGKSFLTRDNKIYLNARKQDRECLIYDLTNINSLTIVENDFPYGEYHKFPYQTEFLYKNSFMDNEVEFYHLNPDDSITFIGVIPKTYYHLYYNFIPLMLSEDFLVCQSYNDVIVGSFDNGEFQESYRFNLGSDSSLREFVAFMRNGYLYSLAMNGDIINIYAIAADDYSRVSTIDTHIFNVNSSSKITPIFNGYVCFRGKYGYNYLLQLDSDNYDIIDIYRLDYEDKVLNNIDNYFFMHSLSNNETMRVLEIKELILSHNPYFETIATIPFPSFIESIDFIPVDENNYNMVVTTMGSLFYYHCAITPNGDFEVTPVTLNALNYPNPFNPETTISYNIEQAGSVSIDVYNLKGQKVKGLVNEKQEAGKHSIIWQGDNDKGQPVSSGTYFYRVKSGEQEVVKKMMMLK